MIEKMLMKGNVGHSLHGWTNPMDMDSVDVKSGFILHQNILTSPFLPQKVPNSELPSSILKWEYLNFYASRLFWRLCKVTDITGLAQYPAHNKMFNKWSLF